MINCGVPQGSVLGPLFFLIYINDVVQVIENCQIRLFADDTCLFYNYSDPNLAELRVNSDLRNIQDWATIWKVNFNVLKTKLMIVDNKKRRNLQNDPQIIFNDITLEKVDKHKHLGMILQSNLKWSSHIDNLITECAKILDIMRKLMFKVDKNSLEIIYFSFLRSKIEYGSILYTNANSLDLAKINKIHNEAIRITTGAT